jgi:hypothetical protein
MNSGGQPLIVMYQDCESTVAQATAALKSAGYLVQQTFNLRTPQNEPSVCACDQNDCYCQMVILLVYAQEGSPATLVFDGSPSQTHISLVTGSAQLACPSLIGSLTQFLPNLLSSTGSSPL